MSFVEATLADQQPTDAIRMNISNMDTPEDEARNVPYDMDITAKTRVELSFADLVPTAGFAPTGSPEPYIDSRTSRLAEFTHLRAKAVFDVSTTAEALDLPLSSSTTMQTSLTDDIAVMIIDQATLVLPEDGNRVKSPHRYMTSMDFVQRQSIVRALRTQECNVNLAERTSLGGVDVIVDPDSAIIVVSLFTLPAHGNQLVDQISELSWRFLRILIILEAYPETLALRPPKSTTDTPNISAYTPPILKAIRKLKRDIVIVEACGKKRTECMVEYAFANNPLEAAKLTRYFGDLAEERDQSGGLLWKSREWLELEVFPVCSHKLFVGSIDEAVEWVRRTKRIWPNSGE